MPTYIDLTATSDSDSASSGVSRRAFVGGMAALAAALGLGGIQNSALAADSSDADASGASDAASSAAAEEDTFPITIKHAFGETVIESKPERVATIAWGNQDAVLALGIVPVGFSAANYGIVEGETMFPWTEEAIEELGGTDVVTFDDTDGVDLEAVNDTKPDIILTPYSGITEDDYNNLTEIAPVVAYPEVAWSTMWRDVVSIEAQALGMSAAGEEIIAKVEQTIADKQAEYPILEGKTGLFTYFDGSNLGSFYVYLLADPRADYLVDLGLAFPESVATLTEGETSFAATISAEQVDVLTDVDVIITYGTEELLEQMQADALIGTIPAIAAGSVVLLDGTTHLAGSSTPTCLSIPATIDEYVGLIVEALEKAEA